MHMLAMVASWSALLLDEQLNVHGYGSDIINSAFRSLSPASCSADAGHRLHISVCDAEFQVALMPSGKQRHVQEQT